MLVPGDIFRSRYRVEGALGGGALHQGYALRDVLGGQRALLYLYGGAAPAGRGRAERVPLDLDSFAYRLARAETLCPGRVPPCQLGEQARLPDSRLAVDGDRSHRVIRERGFEPRDLVVAADELGSPGPLIHTRLRRLWTNQVVPPIPLTGPRGEGDRT